METNVPILSSDWANRKTAYDFIIVGSGYGGSITAARLASASLSRKPSVCLLERGREWRIGSFPDQFDGFLGNVRATNPLGLYDIIAGRDISIMKGNGLGGTSLINANVAIIPEDGVFQQAGWPASLNRQTLMPYYQRASAVLRPNQFPSDKPLTKRLALETRAIALGTHSELLNIVVTFADTPDNGSGISQPACTRCGDCVTGCNVGSKNTLYMNYLPVAHRNGAEIFTQTEVTWVEPASGGGWLVHGLFRADPQHSEAFTLQAENVILSAGSINSTEILLRSAGHGLPISPKVGTGFSGNGDFFGITYNGPAFLQVLGFGNHPGSPGAAFPPGPTITVALRYDRDPQVTNHYLVEDVSFPTALLNAAQLAFPGLLGQEFGRDLVSEFKRATLDISQSQPYSQDGALNHSLIYLVTGFDNAQGQIKLQTSVLAPDGQPVVAWRGAGAEPIFDVINTELGECARALSSRFIENPPWAALGLKALLTAHPLGGCPIGEDSTSGAANEFGQVFASDGSLLAGLRVVDGALLPSALGVNPLLTISALAERIAEHQIQALAGA
jgi:cholesterol oxidase